VKGHKSRAEHAERTLSDTNISVSGFVGIVEALRQAMLSDSWPVRSAAVDVLLQLLPHLWRVARIHDVAVLAPLRTPQRLLFFGAAAIAEGAHLRSGHMQLNIPRPQFWQDEQDI